MKINDYGNFINEKFFRRIFTNSKRTTKTQVINPVDNCVKNILNFLSENEIYNWNSFEKMSPFDRQVIDKLIDSDVKTMKQLKEVRFGIRLELSNRQQLLEYKDELEKQEEYEKCAQVVKKLSLK